MEIVLLAEDIVKFLTNDFAAAEVKDFLKNLIDQKRKEQQERAKKAKLAALAKMKKKKELADKFKFSEVQEEKGPKCVSCEEGYTAKPNEILGVYVFSKRMQMQEWSGIGSNMTTTQGYTTVTHNNFIHFKCHQDAARVDKERSQPIREWEGAKTRNHFTLCNNLFPVLGGNISLSSFNNVVDKFFATQSKYVGPCESNRVKVLC